MLKVNSLMDSLKKKSMWNNQPPGFESVDFPQHVCKLNKALYGLKQTPRAL